MKKSEFSFLNVDDFRGAVLSWYDMHARSLPWRAPYGQNPDPYHVWLSEVMLQQTTVPAVMAYFTKFISIWPSIFDLANAGQDDVLREWAGLGYYARARNLHKCAGEVVARFNGVFPQTLEELESLPGIGAYTAAAIRSIAFDRPASVVDGNIERIYSRIMALQSPLPKGKKQIKALADFLSEGRDDRPGCYAQALMDIGSDICTPKAPNCSDCPIRSFCHAYQAGEAEKYPLKEKKMPKPVRYGVALWLENEDGQVLLEKRPDKGLLGGMTGFPGTVWEKDKALHSYLSDINTMLKDLNINDNISGLETLPEIRHVFTHFELRLKILKLSVKNLPQNASPKNCFFADISKVEALGLPTVFKKAYNVIVKI